MTLFLAPDCQWPWRSRANTFDVDDIFTELLRAPANPRRCHSGESSSSRRRVEETENAYQIHVEVPGVPQENIKVTLEDGALSIKAESNRRTFSYQYRLPKAGVDEANITASLDNGLLELVVPKIPPQVPRSIPIGTAATSISCTGRATAQVDTGSGPYDDTKTPEGSDWDVVGRPQAARETPVESNSETQPVDANLAEEREA